jgi:hypothetical protein
MTPTVMNPDLSSEYAYRYTKPYGRPEDEDKAVYNYDTKVYCNCKKNHDRRYEFYWQI